MLSPDEKWGLPNTSKRTLMAHVLVIEMKNKGGCKVNEMSSKKEQLVNTDAHTFDLMAQVVKTW